MIIGTKMKKRGSTYEHQLVFRGSLLLLYYWENTVKYLPPTDVWRFTEHSIDYCIFIGWKNEKKRKKIDSVFYR